MLAALIQRNNQPEQDSLLELYWNRAGVKRELVSLKRQRFGKVRAEATVDGQLVCSGDLMFSMLD